MEETIDGVKLENTNKIHKVVTDLLKSLDCPHWCNGCEFWNIKNGKCMIYVLLKPNEYIIDSEYALHAKSEKKKCLSNNIEMFRQKLFNE